MSSYEIPIGSLVSPTADSVGSWTITQYGVVQLTGSVTQVVVFNPDATSPPTAQSPIPLPDDLDMTGNIEVQLYWSGTEDATWESAFRMQDNGSLLDATWGNVQTIADVNIGTSTMNKALTTTTLVGSGLNAGEPADIRVRRTDGGTQPAYLHRLIIDFPITGAIASTLTLTWVVEQYDSSSGDPTDGIQTSWTLSNVPASSVVVRRNGIALQLVTTPTTISEYSLVGSVVTFGTAPEATEYIQMEYTYV